MRVQIRTFNCLMCGKENKTTDIQKKFCNKSCSAKYNNKHRTYKPSKDNRTKVVFCKECGKELIFNIRTNDNNVICRPCKNKRKRELYQQKKSQIKKTYKQRKHNFKKSICKHCNNEFLTYHHEQKYCSQQCCRDYQKQEKIKLIENGLFTANHSITYSRVYKKYLIQKRGHRCEICGNTEWMGVKIPLILDHINGHSNDNRFENLRLVCGNCDMQLPTYKSKNKHSDRKYRTEYTKQVARLTPVGAGTALEKQRA